jgi:hypothetical protein
MNAKFTNIIKVITNKNQPIKFSLSFRFKPTKANFVGRDLEIPINKHIEEEIINFDFSFKVESLNIF